MSVCSGKHQWMEMLSGAFILQGSASGGVIPMKDGRWYVFYASYKRIVASAAQGIGWIDSITDDIARLHDKIEGPRFVNVTTWTAAAPDADQEKNMAKSKDKPKRAANKGRGKGKKS